MSDIRGGLIVHYEQFLIEHEILPIDCEKGKWNRFLVHHQSPKDEMSKQEMPV